MSDVLPVVEVSGRFADEMAARDVADALNLWFAWILGGSPDPVPQVFESLGIETVDWAWALEDLDWSVGPHARAVGEDVRVSLQTHETYRSLSGLLRRLGARSVRVHREGD
jgi:hypothetical protein